MIPFLSLLFQSGVSLKEKRGTLILQKIHGWAKVSRWKVKVEMNQLFFLVLPINYLSPEPCPHLTSFYLPNQLVVLVIVLIHEIEITMAYFLG